MDKNFNFNTAEKNSDWAFRQRTHKQRMDWLEDIWELQKIGRLRRKDKSKGA